MLLLLLNHNKDKKDKNYTTWFLQSCLIFNYLKTLLFWKCHNLAPDCQNITSIRDLGLFWNPQHLLLMMGT